MSKANEPEAAPLGSASGLTLLPCAKDVCQQCAVKHAAEQPHDQQSLYWQYYFYGKTGRWPTWVDALAHCTLEVRAQWIAELAKHGITVTSNGKDQPP